MQINKRHDKITRLPVVWARICHHHSIIAPSGSISSLEERRISSIAHLDDRLLASNYACSSVITIPLDGEYPSSVLASAGGHHAVIACREGLAVVNIAQRTCRLLSIGPTGYDQPLCMTVRGSGDDEKLVVAYETVLVLLLPH